jgi:short-subunit dehydrogenase
MEEYALITGASSGIGLELAKIAAANNMNLVLSARNTEKLTQLKTEWEGLYSIKVWVVGCDLAEKDAAEKITAWLQQHYIVPNILINNAGFGMYGSYEQLDAVSEQKMIQLNIASLTALTKTLYGQMRRRGKGKILNVSSIAGFMPGPWMAVYHATKAYVLSFSEALAVEAKGSGVSVTALCPGPTETNFENRASDGAGIKAFQKMGKVPTAQQVAQYGWEKMMKGKTVVIHGGLNRLLLFFIRFMPRKMVTNITGKMQMSKN